MQSATVDVVMPFSQTTVPPGGKTVSWVNVPAGCDKRFVPVSRIRSADDLRGHALRDSLQSFKTKFAVTIRYLGVWLPPELGAIRVKKVHLAGICYEVAPDVVVWPHRPFGVPERLFEAFEGDEIWFELENRSDEPVSLRGGGMIATLRMHDSVGHA